jgi:hypothetical protein
MSVEDFIYDLPAWRGRKRQIAPLIEAWNLTTPEDWHQEKISALLGSCWFIKTFPTPDEYEASVHAIAAEIRKQVFCDGPVANDPDGRLKQIKFLLALSVVVARQAEPPEGFSF